MSHGNLKEKFGVPPIGERDVLLVVVGQMVISVIVLVTVRPPFVCRDKDCSVLDWRMVVFVGIVATVACVLAHACDAAPSDMFRGVWETVRAIR